MIVVFHHCGLSIISNMEFLYSWVTKLYICIAQLENTPIKSQDPSTRSPEGGEVNTSSEWLGQV